MSADDELSECAPEPLVAAGSAEDAVGGVQGAEAQPDAPEWKQDRWPAGAEAPQPPEGRAEDSPRFEDKKVFAANIAYNAPKSRVWEVFERFGKVTNVHLVKNRATGKHKGYGFITFRDKAAVQRALAADGTMSVFLLGRRMRVSPARCRYSGKPTPPGGCHGRNGAGAAPAPRVTIGPPDYTILNDNGPCHIACLPAEILSDIISLLPLPEQMRAQRVCRHWYAIVELCLSRVRRLNLGRMFPVYGKRRLNDRVLRKLLELTPNLEHLRTGGVVSSCSFKALDIVAATCSNLTLIELTGFSINEPTLKRLCIACPKMEQVILPDHYHFSESSVWTLVRYTPCLRALDLNQSARVTGKCFGLLPACLETLSVEGCRGLHASSLRHVAERCPNLKSLDISSLDQISESDVAPVMEQCKKLKKLNMSGSALAPELCVKKPCLSLTELDVSLNRNVTSQTLRELADTVPHVQSLHVQGCVELDDAGLRHLVRFKRLRFLDISFIPSVNDEVLDNLHQLPVLASLRVAECYLGPADFTDEGLTRLVVGCAGLTQLDVSGVAQVTSRLLDNLRTQLSAERRVTILAGDTELQPDPRPADPTDPAAPPPTVTVQPTNTVPLHLRDLAGDDSIAEWSSDDEAYYYHDYGDEDDDDVGFDVDELVDYMAYGLAMDDMFDMDLLDLY